jgi:ribosomal protein S12 methylthiotransferase accessory factor YcaO
MTPQEFSQMLTRAQAGAPQVKAAAERAMREAAQTQRRMPRRGRRPSMNREAVRQAGRDAAVAEAQRLL